MKHYAFPLFVFLATLITALTGKVAGLCNQNRNGLYCSGEKGHRGPHIFTRKG